MKKTLAPLALVVALFCPPALAQPPSSKVPRPAAIDQAEQKLRELAPSEAQAEGLMNLFLGQLPKLMDDNVDPASLVREIQPEAERLLRPDQVQALRAITNETGPLLQFGSMTRQERRALMKDGLEHLNHPDMREWLKRIDSFDL